jgi:hypothetical protein
MLIQWLKLLYTREHNFGRPDKVEWGLMFQREVAQVSFKIGSKYWVFVCKLYIENHGPDKYAAKV